MSIDERWHVLLEQKISEYMTKRYDMVIVANSEVDAINGVLARAYETVSFTANLSYTVLHVIKW